MESRSSFTENDFNGLLPFSISFGSCVGKVKLGMKVNEMLNLLVHEFPRVGYDLVGYSIQDEIQIYIPQWGMRCRFSPRSQSLYLIDILDLQSCPYILNGVTVFQSNHRTTFKSLQKVLGPSFPGKFIDDGFYLLQFDGVGLLFSIPIDFQSLYSNGSILPLELPDGTSPILTRVYICPSDYQLVSKNPYRDITDTRVFLNLSKPEIRIALGDRDSLLTLGMCPQDVLSNVGSPDFSSIHANSDIFFQHFEYYSLGIAVYFSLQHRVSQIALYTNMPCHPDFGRFSRCDYQITHTDFHSDLKLVPETLWSEGEKIITSWLQVGGSKEDVQEHAPAAIKPPPPGSPFPSTKLYGYSKLNLVIEVREDSEIASVVLMAL